MILKILLRLQKVYKGGDHRWSGTTEKGHILKKFGNYCSGVNKLFNPKPQLPKHQQKDR